jgi:hypothetical protein
MEIGEIRKSSRTLVALTWLAVALPLAWGGWITFEKARVLFG